MTCKKASGGRKPAGQFAYSRVFDQGVFMFANNTLPNLRLRLELLYGDQAAQVEQDIRALLSDYQSTGDTPDAVVDPLWNERDVVLITYAGQLRSDARAPLATLREWLLTTGLDEQLSIVHLLPFSPSSSDDGFSVIDYLEVDPAVGDWDDIAALGERVDLMFDLVLNHVSSESDWFVKYLAGESPDDRFFIEVDPAIDLSLVVRPRSLPLLSQFETSRGPRHVWTTFSDDQVDLNYAEPKVLLRMLRVLLEYASRGARIVRLDAVAFLWKRIGTNCLHLPETHEVVKLVREVVAAAFPRVLLLTETNVPHAENVSYFGAGDEAHLVYQFSLPPLLLDAFVNGDAVFLRKWLVELAPPPPGCTFFNFTASHDGVGVRPLEGLVPDERFDRVMDAMRDRGAFINTRRRPDGANVPYELNITYVDALSPTTKDEPADVEIHARRFLASQAVMLALPGMPAVYLHSLVGTQNDYEGVTITGINRRINRHKYQLEELTNHLADKESLAGRIHTGYRRLLEVRRRTPAFHPNAAMKLLDVGSETVLTFRRISLDGGQRVVVIANFGEEQEIDQSHLATIHNGPLRDLLTEGELLGLTGKLLLPTSTCIWLLAE